MTHEEQQERALKSQEVILRTLRGQYQWHEAAEILGISERTIERRKAAGGAFLEAYEKGRSEGRTSLRKWQFEAAKNRNITMLIWLGKQYLGQPDKTDLLSDGQPFRFTIAINGEHDKDS